MTPTLGSVSRLAAKPFVVPMHGEEPRTAALRIKARGTWRTWAWSEVAHLTTALARSQNVDAAASTPAASTSVSASEGEEVLVLGPGPVPRSWAESWRERRFVLSLAEEDGDEAVDLRQLEPHLVIASAARFEGWAQDLAFAAGRQGGVRGRALAALSRAPSTSAAQTGDRPGLLERLAWRRWRATWGLRRARALVVTEGTLSPRALRLFERVGLTVVASAAGREPREHDLGAVARGPVAQAAGAASGSPDTLVGTAAFFA